MQEKSREEKSNALLIVFIVWYIHNLFLLHLDTLGSSHSLFIVSYINAKWTAIRTPERKEMKMRLRYSLGQSPNTIAGAMDRSRTGKPVANFRFWRRCSRRKSWLSPGTGRKILTERAKRHIGFYVSRNLSDTCSEIIAVLNLNVSVSTITQFLRVDHEYIPMMG